MGQFRTLKAADGHEFDCWFEPAEGERRGGIVIIQEIFGVTDQLKGVAERHAAAGYEVAIPALFDRIASGQVIPFDEGPRGIELMMSTELDQTMMDIDAAVRALRANGGEVGAIGYCWGGGLAIRAAQILDIAAAVAFYATRVSAYQVAPLKAPVQAHWGTEDKHGAPEVIAAAQAYFPDMEVHIYDGADHAFANDARPAAYDADAAATANERAREFLARHVG